MPPLLIAAVRRARVDLFGNRSSHLLPRRTDAGCHSEEGCGTGDGPPCPPRLKGFPAWCDRGQSRWHATRSLQLSQLLTVLLAPDPGHLSLARGLVLATSRRHRHRHRHTLTHIHSPTYTHTDLQPHTPTHNPLTRAHTSTLPLPHTHRNIPFPQHQQLLILALPPQDSILGPRRALPIQPIIGALPRQPYPVIQPLFFPEGEGREGGEEDYCPPFQDRTACPVQTEQGRTGQCQSCPDQFPHLGPPEGQGKPSQATSLSADRLAAELAARKPKATTRLPDQSCPDVSRPLPSLKDSLVVTTPNVAMPR